MFSRLLYIFSYIFIRQLHQWESIKLSFSVKIQVSLSGLCVMFMRVYCFIGLNLVLT